MIVEDYAPPDALCVPVWKFNIQSTLEAIAHLASLDTGVILVGPDPSMLTACAEAAREPDHCAIVTGALDSPWLRDHSPIAAREAGGLRFVMPRRIAGSRPHDAELFGKIFTPKSTKTAHHLATGNIVAGPDGLCVSTTSVLRDNNLSGPDALIPDARLLGITDWLFVPPFPDDISRHTDCMIRFLAPDLCAVLMRRDRAAATDVSYAMIEAMEKARPGIEVLPLTAIVKGADFNSPMNWIQLGQRLLIPDFGDGTGFTDTARAALTARGYDLCPVPTGTARLGGALRCLTATIFAD